MSVKKATAATRVTGAASALLVIDVQRELFAKSTPIDNAEAVLANINTLVAGARRSGAPVVWVQHGATGHLIEDSEGWQIHPALQPQAGDIMIRKRHPSPFEDTPLQAELAKRDVGALVICGLVTHGCVRATTLHAHELGYRVTLATDAHSSYNKDAPKLIEEWNQKLAQGVAQVQPAEDICFA